MDLLEKLKELGNSATVKERKGEDGAVKGIKIEITVGSPDENASQEELETRIEELEEELEHLEDLMAAIEAEEPFDLGTAAYERWQVRMNLIEEQIDVVEDEISELEEELEEE